MGQPTEHKLLDQIALVYLQQKKKPEDAYKMALDAILTGAIPYHRKLETEIKRLKSRGEV